MCFYDLPKCNNLPTNQTTSIPKYTLLVMAVNGGECVLFEQNLI